MWEVTPDGLFPDDITMDVVKVLCTSKRAKVDYDDGPKAVYYEGPEFAPRRAWPSNT